MLLKKNTSGSMMKSRRKSENTKTNDDENTTSQNLWDAAKTVLNGKFITIEAFLKKQEKSQTT